MVPSEAIDSEIDVDVKPMMNVLLILIPFLVSVAVYTRLAVIDMSLPPNVSAVASSQGDAPKLKLTVVMAPAFLTITLGETVLDSLVKYNDDYPYDSLAAHLKQRRQAAQIQDEVIVAPRDGIHFKYVVRVMDACRSTGFAKISLASATENPSDGR
jgi:biopolymer transport protein ExbD